MPEPTVQDMAFKSMLDEQRRRIQEQFAALYGTKATPLWTEQPDGAFTAAPICLVCGGPFGDGSDHVDGKCPAHAPAARPL